MAYDTGPARSQGQGGAILVSCFILCYLEAWLEGQGEEAVWVLPPCVTLGFPPFNLRTQTSSALCVPPCFNFGSYLE